MPSAYTDIPRTPQPVGEGPDTHSADMIGRYNELRAQIARVDAAEDRLTSAEQLAYNVKRYAKTTAQRDACGNGNSKPLSGYYGTLAAAQVDYPHAVALTDELDWAILQAALNAAKAYIPDGTYLVNRMLEMKIRLGWVIEGSGAVVGNGVTTGGAAIKWNGAAGIVAPTQPTLTRNAAGGTLTADVRSYVITAINAAGETMPSAFNHVTSVANDSITVSWTAVAGATGYKIYRGTSVGINTPNHLLLATVGAVTTYTDDGSVTPAGAMPTTNTTGGGTVMMLQNVARGRLANLSVWGDFKAKIGIDYDAVSGQTPSTKNRWRNVRVEGCVDSGLLVAKSSFQTDQTEYYSCSFHYNYFGVRIMDANAVWHSFFGCHFGYNDVGITDLRGNGGHYSLHGCKWESSRQWDAELYASRARSFVDCHSERSFQFLKGSQSTPAAGHPLTLVGCSVNDLTVPAAQSKGRPGVFWNNSSPLVFVGGSYKGNATPGVGLDFKVWAGGSTRGTVIPIGTSFDGNPFDLTSMAYQTAFLPMGSMHQFTADATKAQFLGNPLPYRTAATAAAASTTAADAAAAVGSRWAELAWVKIPSGTALVAGANLFYWRSNNCTGLCRIEIPTIHSTGGADAVLLGIGGRDNNAGTALTAELNLRCSGAFTLTSDLVFAVRFAPEPVASG